MPKPAAEVNGITVCGIHAVAAMLRENRATRLYAIDSGASARLCELLAAATAAGVPVIRQPRAGIARRAEQEHHQGVVAEASLPAGDLPTLLQVAAPLVVLDGVTDPRNLGAVMRVVRAFGGAAVVAAARRAAPLTAAALRAAAGAAAQIPVVRVANIVRALRQIDDAGRTIIGAVEDGGTDLFSQPLPPAPCWVLGDEGIGIRRLVRAHCHQLLRIPTVAGDAGCLNVAAAGAICLAAGSRREATALVSGQ